MHVLDLSNLNVPLDKVIGKVDVTDFMGSARTAVWKLPFKLNDTPYFNGNIIYPANIVDG